MSKRGLPFVGRYLSFCIVNTKCYRLEATVDVRLGLAASRPYTHYGVAENLLKK
ncbi:hypothetical protein D3C73_429670 [compost metagenome]